MPRIVTLRITQTIAPTPSRLQQTGAAISQGGTTLANGQYALLTQAEDLVPILAAALSISSIAWSGGTAVATTTAAIPGLTTGDTFVTSLAGQTPAGYSGTVKGTVTGANTFSFPLASNPGAETVPGTYTPPNQLELIAMVDEVYSQGSSQAVYVLELGAGDGASGPTALSTWIQANPGFFYSYLVPRLWDGTANYLTLVKAFEANDAKTYFFTTTTVGNYTLYAGIKSVYWFIESPDVGLTSFDCASHFQQWLSNNPGPGNLASPMAWRFTTDTTPYPQQGNAALLATLDLALVNYVTTGAEGGIAEDCIANGCFADGNSAMYWYAIDWLDLQFDLLLSNAIINAANNGAPINYDQNGINTLQDVGFSVLSNGIAFNLLNGTASRTALPQQQFVTNEENGDYADINVINAVPFRTYVQQNPSAYKEKEYGGYTAVAIPQEGLESILFNLNATQFV